MVMYVRLYVRLNTSSRWLRSLASKFMVCSILPVMPLDDLLDCKAIQLEETVSLER